MDSQIGKNNCVFLLLLKFLILKWSAHVILGSLSQILPAKEGFIYICYITLFFWGAMLKLCEDLWGMKWYSESCGELLVLVLFYLPMQYMKERISRKDLPRFCHMLNSSYAIITRMSPYLKIVTQSQLLMERDRPEDWIRSEHQHCYF